MMNQHGDDEAGRESRLAEFLVVERPLVMPQSTTVYDGASAQILGWTPPDLGREDAGGDGRDAN